MQKKQPEPIQPVHKKQPAPILPEAVIRMLAYGVLAGILVVVIYSTQAFFIQAPVKPPAPATVAPAAPPPGSASLPAQPAAADKPAQKAPPTPGAAGSKAGTTVSRPDAVSAGKASESAAPPVGTASPSHLGRALSVMGTGLLLSGSAMLTGVFLGFLFGIPRSLQQQGMGEPTAPASPPPPAPGAPATTGAAQASNAQSAPARIAYGPNTSLEQISDWLTKILVGVGLTQLSSLPSALARFADFAIPGLGGFETSGVFATALLIYFTTCGFLMSYLWARLYLGRALSNAEVAEIKNEIVSDLQSMAQAQMAIDYEALRLTEKQLESGDVPQAELDKALRGTSDIYRTHIYQLAKRARSENWRDSEHKKKMERTIPVFRALVATDDRPGKAPYFQNFAQLGFALAESDPPRYEDAIAALNKATELRGSADAHGYVLAEYVRAKCLADPARKDAETKERILADLRVALKVWPDLVSLLRKDTRLSGWMEANQVTVESLLPQSR